MLPQQFMVMSLPNSGSDWFCQLLAKHGPGLRYFHKEFFNPICNPKYANLLEIGFGCELAGCYRNIGVPAYRQMNQLVGIYDATWQREEFNFNKENYGAVKLEFFDRYFQLAFLHRPASNVFPPSRLRVWTFYDAIHAALVEAGQLSRRADSLKHRCHDAHEACWEVMEEFARECDYPIFEYELLCRADVQTVTAHLDRGWVADMVDVPALAAEIVATRRYTPKQASR